MSRRERLLIAKHFDAQYYLEANPDVARNGINPLTHFLKYGWREGRNPTSDFNLNDYLALNPAAASSKINPYYFYLMYGRSAARNTTNHEGAVRDISNMSNEVHMAIREDFDTQYYLKAYPDIREAGIDALEHFIRSGWREGRNPNSHFSTNEYLDANPDVRAANINPFYHYCVAGKSELRPLRLPLIQERRIIDSARSMRVRAEAALKHQQNRATMSRFALGRALDLLIPRHRDRLIISMSHDEYTLNVGGIQNCLGDEQRAANFVGVSYLHLAPTSPSLYLWPDTPPSARITITVDGERIGHAYQTDIIDYFATKAFDEHLWIALIIHSFLGHNAPFILRLHEQLHPNQTAIWIHDCSTLCSNFALLRNDIEFCWSCEPASWGCRTCVYGSERLSHLQTVNEIFSILKPKVYFPSTAIRDFWVERGLHTFNEAIVAPHAKAEITGSLRPIAYIRTPLKIAFVGAAASHKGWDTYVQLSKLLANDPRYIFFHFASHPGSAAENISFVEVSVTPENRNAMTDILLLEEIDVVVQWTLCFETFSFSTLEAILAGAFVIVRAGSGNAAASVKEANAGVELPSVATLVEIFASGEICDLVLDYRSRPICTGRVQITDESLTHLIRAN